MKKNSLTMAVVAGFAGAAGLANVATAVNVNPDGLGQVLIYPYYTVNQDLNTLISVVNTVDETKAVKVRFLEAKNSREVLDFNLYMSPFDVWTASVAADGDSPVPGRLSTSDTSCTVPAIPAGGVDFRNFQYAGGAEGGNDDGENDLGRTREGYVEMIEMGVVDEDVNQTLVAMPIAGINEATGYEAAAKHGADPDGVGQGASATPANCGLLRRAWLVPSAATNSWTATLGTIDVRGPTGGLFGSAIIVNPATGLSMSYNAEAVDGFYTLNNAALHTAPGSTFPRLSDVNNGGGVATARIFDNGVLYQLDYAAGTPDAVSALFMHDAVFNEFVTAGDFAKTEWVLTFPTKALHLANYIDAAPLTSVLPFANDEDDAGDDLAFDVDGYCEPILVTYYDREEQQTGVAPGDVDFSPPPPTVTQPGTNLCWEANVLTWNQTAEVTDGASAVLGSRIANNINLVDVGGAVFSEGWINLTIGNANNYLDDLGLTTRLGGLPLVGFQATNFYCEDVAGVCEGALANYGVIARHRSSRDVTPLP